MPLRPLRLCVELAGPSPTDAPTIAAMLLLLTTLLTADDTLRIRPLTTPPGFDGVVREAEYGTPMFELGGGAGWVARYQDTVIIAVRFADSTFYWGDDVVVSLDVWGDRGTAPGHDDFQWYLRRTLDSSVVFRGEQGKWRAPRDDPDWRLGQDREGGGWEVRAVSDSAGWSLELRLDAAFFREARPGATPALAVRTYNDAPHGWATWPARDGLRHPTELERRPEWWVPVRLTP